MTLSTTTARVSYAGNGATTSFAFAYKVWAASNLKVYLRDNTTLVDTLQTLVTHYSIDIVTYPNTGNVVFVTAPASGQTVVIVRDMPLTQELDLIASGSFAAENVEAQLDKLAAEIQTLREMIARTPRLPIGTSLVDLEIPNLSTAVAGDALCVNATGDGWTLAAAAVSSATVSAFMATVLDDSTASAALTTLGFSTFVKTLIDDADALAFLNTLGFAAGSGTVDFGNVSDNVTATGATIQVLGAATGDWVLCISASGDIATTAGARLYGVVTAADTVTPYLANDSAGSFNAASQTLYVLVLKKSAMNL